MPRKRTCDDFIERTRSILSTGSPTTYNEVAMAVNKLWANTICQFWDNNISNGDRPIYDIGELSVPPSLPMYVVRPQEDRSFIIEKKEYGEYKPLIGECYLIEAEAQARAEQLNADAKVDM